MDQADAHSEALGVVGLRSPSLVFMARIRLSSGISTFTQLLLHAYPPSSMPHLAILLLLPPLVSHSHGNTDWPIVKRDRNKVGWGSNDLRRLCHQERRGFCWGGTAGIPVGSAGDSKGPLFFRSASFLVPLSPTSSLSPSPFIP